MRLFITFEIMYFFKADVVVIFVLAILAIFLLFSGNRSMIIDQEKHQRVEYVQGDREMGLKVNLPTFKNLHLLDDFAEIELTKTRQKLNLPMQIGFAILQYAKLKCRSGTMTCRTCL